MVLRNPQTRPSLGGLDQTKTKSDQTIPITGLHFGLLFLAALADILVLRTKSNYLLRAHQAGIRSR
ncbi:uncharacterized protein BKA55DRAFT_199610 [Fusarium redolens]|uniref:Uncharacterized protein n=1 Tax=Fusarium redolens TaxID=48865 RepID=A0A9P9G3G0_FUSRE|nr:uncharacterized protein BKA55DRAFT_199610 [Fusarium redolens]KAH7231410.1 hypothetical protein BKA55DRAFT_199610 [Fusarium redolens]